MFKKDFFSFESKFSINWVLECSVAVKIDYYILCSPRAHRLPWFNKPLLSLVGSVCMLVNVLLTHTASLYDKEGYKVHPPTLFLVMPYIVNDDVIYS